jgi:hypothetical protein
VANCFCNSEKRYAFVEMATPDEASKCLASLDGVKVGESELKITRPQDYTQHSGMVAGVGMLHMPLSMPGAPSMPAPGAPMGLANPLAQQQMLMQQQQQQLLQMQMRQQHMQQAAAMQAANAAQMAQANSLGALGRPMVPGMAAKPSIPLEEALEISKKARVLKFGNLPEDDELQKGMAAFLNELYKALKLNTVGGDSCVSAAVDPAAKTAVVEFRTVKEAAAAKSHLNGVEYGSSKLTVEAPEGFSDLTPEARLASPPVCMHACPSAITAGALSRGGGGGGGGGGGLRLTRVWGRAGNRQVLGQWRARHRRRRAPQRLHPRPRRGWYTPAPRPRLPAAPTSRALVPSSARARGLTLPVRRGAGGPLEQRRRQHRLQQRRRQRRRPRLLPPRCSSSPISSLRPTSPTPLSARTSWRTPRINAPSPARSRRQLLCGLVRAATITPPWSGRCLPFDFLKQKGCAG